jgi:putative effector of murein hydrolase LrgA (UPF0299 family)
MRSRALLDHPTIKGAISLIAALTFLFLPVAVDAIRARQSATPIRITAHAVSSHPQFHPSRS